MSSRKTPVPDSVRIQVVQRYGLMPGAQMRVPCHYCKRLGRLYWPKRKDGQGVTRVRSEHEFDHVVPEPAPWAIAGLTMNVKGAPIDRHLAANVSALNPNGSPLGHQVLEFEGLTDGI